MRNGPRRFDAACGHEVGAYCDYIRAHQRSWCSPRCAAEADAGTCRWIGCDRDGELREIAVTVQGPGGVSLLATFSDAFPLCDEHHAATQTMVEETLAVEFARMTEEGHGEEDVG